MDSPVFSCLRLEAPAAPRVGIRPHRAARFALFAALLGLAEAALAVPRFTSTAVTAVNEDVAYRYDITTADTQSGSRQVTAPVLPSWLTLSNVNNNGSARITGTPTQAQVGTHAVSLQVRNVSTNSTAVQNFSIVVANVNDAPVITGQTPNPIPLQQATALTITLGHLLVTDVDNPYPTGFTLTVSNGSNYTRSGNTITPTANFLGTLTVPVRVSDGVANSANFNLAVSVAAPATADLSLQVAATPAAALVNGEVEWQFTVANAGPQSASAVELTAEFAGNPFGFTLLSSCTVTPAADRQRLTCAPLTVPVGASASVTLRGAAAQDGDVFVAASVRRAAGTPNDPNPANDTATATLHVAQTLSGREAQRLAGTDHGGAAAGDVNGDGFADVVLAKRSGGAAAELYLNVVDSDPARRRLAAMPLLIGTSAGGSNVALVDLDGDTDLDLVATPATGNSSTVYLNTGSGAFAASVTLAAGTSRDVAAADLDGDGAQDLAFANSGASTVYLNRGASGFTRTADLGTDDSRDVIAVDLDLDGLPDLVFANANGPSRFYRNLGAGRFAAGVVVDTLGAHSVAAGDFNRDGRPDLVFGVRADAAGPPSNSVYQNNPGAGGAPLFVLTRRIGAAPTAQVLTGDLDGDGTVDVVTLNLTGTHQVYRGDGAGGLALHPVQFAWAGVAGAVLAKLSVDSAVDLAVGGATNSAVFFNDGRGGLGLGDTTVPVLQLLGAPTVTVTVGDAYSDAGATATDDVDGNLTPRIAVTNPVNTAVVGAYTVSYQVRDSAGNAVQATRSVQVAAREGVGGGGGGATHPFLAVCLALLCLCRMRSRLQRARLPQS